MRPQSGVSGIADRSLGFADREHLSACSLETRIREIDSKRTPTRRLWIIGALVLAWRALQLLVDLPLPALQPIVPFAVVAVTLWLLAGDALAVETFAPELQKRGI